MQEVQQVKDEQQVDRLYISWKDTYNINLKVFPHNPIIITFSNPKMKLQPPIYLNVTPK
jgi:hypothetical protein